MADLALKNSPLKSVTTMAKADIPKKPRVPKYEHPLAAKEGSFLEIMKASVKYAERKAAEKRKEE